MADPMQAQLDAAARQQGFKNYAQWSAWNARQQEMRGIGQVAPPAQQNWLQQLISSVPGHPAQTLGYVRRKMDEYLK